MSKPKTKDEIIAHKKSAIKKYNNMLEKLLSTNDPKLIKKVDTLSYWLETYTNYLSFENNFDPKKMLNYKRGDVIRVNFGYNVGAELGGLHFAAVLDSDSKHSSKVLTVIPLSSTDGRKVHERSVDLGSELYTKIINQYNKMLNEIKEHEKESQNAINAVKEFFSLITDASQIDNEGLVRITKIVEEQEIKQQKIENEIASLEQQKLEIESLKKGSMAITNQITTISKQRIYVPKHSGDFLHNVSLSSAAMTKINEKIKSLYLYE